MKSISDIYRLFPRFKGKKRIGSLLFRKSMFAKNDQLISCQRGLKYHILNTHDSVGRDLFFDGIYEPRTISKIESLLQAGDIMIDAGANIGAITLPVAKDRKIKVYAFEPAKHIHEILQQNIQINTIKNIEAFAVGLSDRQCSADFYESDRVHGWSGMVKIDSFRHYQVPVISLDQFAAERDISIIKVLKMDVQGWEYFVLKGAEKLITEKRIAHIIFEFEWWAEKNAGLQPGSAQQFLLDNGYKIQTPDGKKISTPLTEGSFILHAYCD